MNDSFTGSRLFDLVTPFNMIVDARGAAEDGPAPSIRVSDSDAPA